MKLPWNKKAELDFSEDGTLVVVRLNAKLQPTHRGEIFEDPLVDQLTETGTGSWAGGGTLLDNESGEIEFCEIELYAPDAGAEFIERLTTFLNTLGAPKGSRILVGEDEEIEYEVGLYEGLGLYLNGSELPDEVYATQDVNELIKQLEDALGAAGERFSHWEGPTETALYFYGPSFAEMAAAIKDVVGSHPLAQRARVVQIA